MSSGQQRYPSAIGDCDMTIHAAMIAQTGREYVNRQSTSGPRRGTLTIIGSVSSFLTPSRLTVSGTGAYGGFGAGVNDYDPFLLHTPPPSFPTVGFVPDPRLARAAATPEVGARRRD